MRAIVVEQPGGPEALQLKDIPTPQPQEKQVLVRVEAAGVNFLDIYQRNGANQMPLPFVAGNEGSGTVVAVGRDVTRWAPGDRVAWAMIPGSGYTENAALPEDRLVAVPNEVDSRTAAAVLLQGMTAHYLSTSAFPARSGQTAAVTGAAGGTGLLLCQMLRAKGVRVIGTVSTREKAELAQQAGAAETVLYRETDLVAEIRRLTNGTGVDVAYDGIGRDTSEALVASLRTRGTMVIFGAASGPAPLIDPMLLLRAGSVYLTRTTITDFIATTEELDWRAREVFDAVAAGRLSVTVNEEFALSEAPRAHRLLEGGQTTGKLLLRL